jgi:RimJ/RimL family protein N-acetyltransferase
MVAPSAPTLRLTLLPVSPLMQMAMQSSPAAFASLLGVTLPRGWPQFPEAFHGEVQHPDPWTGYVFMQRDAFQLVGNGGFVAPPDAAGAVEIGYEIAPALRNLGYATEAAQGLLSIAFGSGAVSVVAHSLPSPNASNAVMQKLGMRFVGEFGSADAKVWRWQIDRPFRV